jgi:hypothetical protein
MKLVPSRRTDDGIRAPIHLADLLAEAPADSHRRRR